MDDRTACQFATLTIRNARLLADTFHLVMIQFSSIATYNPRVEQFLKVSLNDVGNLIRSLNTSHNVELSVSSSLDRIK